MSNESALLLSIVDQLNDSIEIVKKEIEPNRVTIPASWRKDGKYNNTYRSTSNQPYKSKPLPDAIAEKIKEALAAPRDFRIEHGNHIDPEGYEWWDRAFWPLATIRSRVRGYVNHMEQS